MRTGAAFATASSYAGLPHFAATPRPLPPSADRAPVGVRFRACFAAPAASVTPPPGAGPATSAVAGMKPPPRRRAAPARYRGEVAGGAVWSALEKRQLLRLLQARRGQPEPDVAELAGELPGRSEAEVTGSRKGEGWTRT